MKINKRGQNIKGIERLTNFLLLFTFEADRNLIEQTLDKGRESVVHVVRESNYKRDYIKVFIPFNRARPGAEPVERLPVLPPVPEFTRASCRIVPCNIK